jgi:hypothetical protein
MTIKESIEQQLNHFNTQNIRFWNEQEQNLVLFNKQINEKILDFAMIYAFEEDMVVFNIIIKFPTNYENPGIDFYEVLQKLNDNCIHGYVSLSKEETLQIAYKSSYIGDASNFSGNKSFNYYLKVTFDMVGFIHQELE